MSTLLEVPALSLDLVPDRPSLQVLRWLVEHGFAFKQEYKVGCHRVDFLIVIGLLYILLEIDEKQHLSYNVQSEFTRSSNILNALTKWHIQHPDFRFLIVRFNPDSYSVGETIKNPSLANRLTMLKLYLAQYKPSDTNPIACGYYCYDVDMFGNLRSPFLESNEPLKKMAFAITADPDAVTQLPINQVKIDQRVQRKLKHVDPRDMLLEQLKKDLDEKQRQIKTLKRKADFADDVRQELEQQRFSDRVRQMEAKVSNIPNMPNLPAPREDVGGIYRIVRPGRRDSFAIQFLVDGDKRRLQLGSKRFPRKISNSELAETLRKYAQDFGLGEVAIEKSLQRLGLSS